jgi:hypothetical protein
MSSMRPIRAIATALLVASLAVAGCGRSQPDQPTTPPTGPPVTAAPTPTNPPEPVPEPPQILGVRMLPQPSEQEGGWLLVADLVVVEVNATRADRARLVHTPTGTEAARYAKVVAQDTTGADGLRLTWHPEGYGSLTLKVTGPGGTTTRELGDFYHQ